MSEIILLQDRLGYTFKDIHLLEMALTHVSAIPTKKLQSYQRLEFLGDRVLGLVVSDMLYKAFPNAEEGELSRRLAELVRKESCTEVARSWQVGASLRLGEGENAAGARDNAAIVADVCEAIFGAVFLDGGFEAARILVNRSFEARMHAPRRPLRDPKTALQEWAQGRGLAAPTYQIIDRTGPDHAPRFRVMVQVDNMPPAEGKGTSKRAAEQNAAERLLTREGIRTLQL